MTGWWCADVSGRLRPFRHICLMTDEIAPGLAADLGAELRRRANTTKQARAKQWKRCLPAWALWLVAVAAMPQSGTAAVIGLGMVAPLALLGVWMFTQVASNEQAYKQAYVEQRLAEGMSETGAVNEYERERVERYERLAHLYDC
jgi:hypothetical protein